MQNVCETRTLFAGHVTVDIGSSGEDGVGVV
jgi:hypothetical protein